MEKKGRSFWKKLNHPAHWIALLIHILTLTLCPLAVLSIVLDYGDSIYATIGYVICGILLLYSLTSAGIFIYKKITKVADRYSFTRHLHKSYAFRSLFFTTCSFVFNIGFTLFLCVMALRLDSAWYGALAVYYILLTLTRGGMLIQTNIDEHKFKDNLPALHKAKVGTYLYTGIMILFLTAAFAVSVVQVVMEGAGVRVPAWAIYSFAAFTGVRLFMAIWNFVKSSSYKDLTTRSAQYINMTTALVSLLSLQTALLSLIRTDLVPALINAITGGLVCVAELAIGVYMIVHSGVKYKKIKRKERLLKMQEQAESGYNRDGYADEYGANGQ
ncbi:MAG: hypothetical protein IJX30_07050 [Clostridia bacterium]|nr:hypothetical protein [Clostridia bacterium]